MKRILLDVDGVLGDFTAMAVREVNNLFDTSFTVADVTQFDFAAALGLTASQAADVKRIIAGTAGLCTSIVPYPGAAEAVERLKSIAPVYVVTAPWHSSPTWVHERTRWITRHFDVGPNQQIHTSAKYAVRGAMLVDDKASAVERWQAENPEDVGVFWASPHNRSETCTARHVSSWEALVEIAAGLRDGTGR